MQAKKTKNRNCLPPKKSPRLACFKISEQYSCRAYYSKRASTPRRSPFSSFLNVLAVSINVACNSENQCLLMQRYHKN